MYWNNDNNNNPKNQSMDGDRIEAGWEICIANMMESNFHEWKQKTGSILTYQEVDAVRSGLDFYSENTPEYAIWVRKDKLARGIISLSLVDVILEHVRDSASTEDMVENISTVIHRHSLFDQLCARVECYTV